MRKCQDTFFGENEKYKRNHLLTLPPKSTCYSAIYFLIKILPQHSLYEERYKTLQWTIDLKFGLNVVENFKKLFSKIVSAHIFEICINPPISIFEDPHLKNKRGNNLWNFENSF